MEFSAFCNPKLTALILITLFFNVNVARSRRRQVTSTNIGAIVTVSFNVASFDANLDDWAWILGGVDPSFGVADANALESSAVYHQFSEGCWFYFGRAATLGHPFLCSRDPDTELASLQASTLDYVLQYGSLELYSAAAGNVSIWYAKDEAYDFAMVSSYHTCGIDVRVPPSSMVRHLRCGMHVSHVSLYVFIGPGRVGIVLQSCTHL